MSDFSKRLGERLQLLRGEATLRHFAPKLGLDARSLHRIERGKQNVTLETLATICQRLKCTAGDLLDDPAQRLGPKKHPTQKKTASR